MTGQMIVAQGLVGASSDWPWWVTMIAAVTFLVFAMVCVAVAERTQKTEVLGLSGPAGCMLYLVAVVFTVAGMWLLGYAFIG